jgi:hypothetical protein
MNEPLLYYPLVKEGEYASLSDLCQQRGFDADLVDRYVKNAEIERSPLVFCDRLSLEDDPEIQVCAALRLDDHGVSLWAALIGEASADRDEVLAVIGLLQEQLPEKEIMLAEFVPSLRMPN